MFKVIAFTAACAALVAAVVFALSGAGGEQLLANGGFESGTTSDWTAIDAALSVTNDARTGNHAALMTTGVGEHAAVIAQQNLPVQPGAPYEFSGWAAANNPDIDRVFLEVEWYNDGAWVAAVSSNWLVDDFPGYRYLTTGPVFAPLGVSSATLTLTLVTVDSASVLIDDLSFARVEAITPRPTEAPTNSPTPTPSLGTTATGTSSPTPASSTPASASPTRNATATASATPRATPKPTPSEPLVFPGLTNGGFEQPREDNTPYGWRKIGGTIEQGERRRGGLHSLALTSDTTSTKWAYQTVSVQGGAYFEAFVFATQQSDSPGEVFLRISWYASANGTGEALSFDDSLETLASNSRNFQQLQTGPAQAPSTARSARVRLMLRPANDQPATAYFDDASLERVEAPADTPRATRTPTTTPEPTATTSAIPTRTPRTTPLPTGTYAPTPTPSAPPTAQPTPSPKPVEPHVFSVLVNGGFEDAREDGTPYGWHKIGGEIVVSEANRTHGELGLELTSETTATKWAYQVVTVAPGAHYEATVWAMNTNANDELSLRISWYASEDGSGAAIDTAGSTASVTGDLAGFRQLATGAVQAPQDARSARIRLLLHPASGARASSHFDEATFNLTAPPTLVPPTIGSAASTAPATTARPSAQGSSASAAPVAVLGARSTLPPLANVRPAEAAPGLSASDSGGGITDWLLGAAVAVPAIGIAALLGADYVRGRRESSSGATDS